MCSSGIGVKAAGLGNVMQTIQNKKQLGSGAPPKQLGRNVALGGGIVGGAHSSGSGSAGGHATAASGTIKSHKTTATPNWGNWFR